MSGRVLSRMLGAGWLGLLSVALHAASAGSGAPAEAPAEPDAPAKEVRLTITALANAGVMLSDGRTAVLIDALFRDGVEGYARLEGAARARLERAQPPYDAVRLILVTHWHADHFDPAAVAAHLAKNRRAVAVMTDQVAATLMEKTHIDRARIDHLTPERGRWAEIRANGLPVTLVRLAHNPSLNYPNEHVAQGVRLAGRLILHVGDADPNRDNFKAVDMLGPVDVAIVPYWYLLSEAGREIVRDRLQAREVIAVHLEPERSKTISAEVRKAWPGARVFARAGDRAEF